MSHPGLWIGLALSGLIVFFSTANFALRHLSRVRLAERLEERGKSQWLTRLMERRSELLFVSTFLRLSSILAMVLLVAYFFESPPQARPVRHYGGIFLCSLAVVMTFGFAIPNAWAWYGGARFLAAVLPFLMAIGWAFYPLTVLHHLFDALVRRLAGIPSADSDEAEADQIEQEILGVVSEGELAGAVHEEDADMIESVMEFRNTDVAEIMTPRIEIVALPATATLEEARDLVTREGHSRIPVYGETIDEIKGVLYAKDLLKLDGDEPFNPLKIMRKVPFVPESKKIAELLRELRQQKVHLAVVLDEYGGTAGLVTIEDILEEIVGEIADEYEEPEPEPIRRIDDNTVEIDARVHVDELNDELKIEIPEEEDYDTVGGFIFAEMGKIPKSGDEFRYKNVSFKVLAAEERRINRLRVAVVPEDAPA